MNQKIDLSEFESKVVVRNIQPGDFDRIVAMQKACFPKMAPWSREQFDSQMELFPEGQFCVEYDGEIVASATSLIVDFDLYSEWHNWKEISDNGYIRNHDPNGDALYGIEIMVDPEYRGMKLARRLLAEMNRAFLFADRTGDWHKLQPVLTAIDLTAEPAEV